MIVTSCDRLIGDVIWNARPFLRLSDHVQGRGWHQTRIEASTLGLLHVWFRGSATWFHNRTMLMPMVNFAELAASLYFSMDSCSDVASRAKLVWLVWLGALTCMFYQNCVNYWYVCMSYYIWQFFYLTKFTKVPASFSTFMYWPKTKLN